LFLCRTHDQGNVLAGEQLFTNTAIAALRQSAFVSLSRYGHGARIVVLAQTNRAKHRLRVFRILTVFNADESSPTKSTKIPAHVPPVDESLLKVSSWVCMAQLIFDLDSCFVAPNPKIVSKRQ
jgi:hypothetical protein